MASSEGQMILLQSTTESEGTIWRRQNKGAAESSSHKARGSTGPLNSE